MVNRLTVAGFDVASRLHGGRRASNNEEGVPDDVANMADFYDTMTEKEIYQNRMKLATRMIMGEF